MINMSSSLTAPDLTSYHPRFIFPSRPFFFILSTTPCPELAIRIFPPSLFPSHFCVFPSPAQSSIANVCFVYANLLQDRHPRLINNSLVNSQHVWIPSPAAVSLPKSTLILQSARPPRLTSAVHSGPTMALLLLRVATLPRATLLPASSLCTTLPRARPPLPKRRRRMTRAASTAASPLSAAAGFAGRPASAAWSA
ncbi:hypothetical protein LZ32DRAFT_399432 [Colletotrichum eremochloae]|nr:hypothetical protein LZ32DRAFT_399432 [Colletotrichum eremochloae]